VKIRQGFVSNSSSSSFICDICGNVESERDASLEDLGFVRCENGHEFCDHHLTRDIETIMLEAEEAANAADDEFDSYEYRGELPAHHCPLCKLEKLSDADCLRYMLKTLDQTKEEVLEKIKTMHGTYPKFMAALKEKK
jgi:hypothetical protein